MRIRVYKYKHAFLLIKSKTLIMRNFLALFFFLIQKRTFFSLKHNLIFTLTVEIKLTIMVDYLLIEFVGFFMNLKVNNSRIS